MTALPSLGASALVGRMEFRRRLRSVRENPLQMVAVGLVGVLTVLPMTVGGAYLAYRLGVDVRTGDVDPEGAVTVARGLFALLWVGAAGMTVARAVGKVATVDESDGLLTTTRVPNVVAGIMLAEVAGYLAWTLPVLLSVGGGYVAGARAPLLLLTTPLAMAAVLATAVPAGYTVGVLVRHVVNTYEVVARHKGKLGVLAFVAYFWVISSGGFERAFTAVYSSLQESPPGWLGDLLLLGAPGLGASTPRAAAALGLSVVAVPVLLGVASRAAERHWFADPARPEEDEPVAEYTRSSRLATVLEPVTTRRTRAVTVAAWQRALRAPIKLTYAAYPLLGLVYVARDVLSGGVPGYLPYVTVFYVVWASGAAITLNPLGDQGPVLPSTLTTPVSGGQFARGNVLAGLLPAVPLGTVATAVAAVLVGLDFQTAAGLTALAAAGSVAGPLYAVGVGTAFPRFGAVSIAGNRKAVMPSKTAFVVYSLSVVLTVGSGAALAERWVRVAVAGVLSFLLTEALPLDPITLTPRTVEGIAAVLLAVLLVAPLFAYRYATLSFDGYTLD